MRTGKLASASMEARGPISTDNVNETTPGAGVKVAGLPIKNGGFNLTGDADGDLYYRFQDKLVRLPKGAPGTHLVMDTNGEHPVWEAFSSSGILVIEKTDSYTAVVGDAGSLLVFTGLVADVELHVYSASGRNGTQPLRVKNEDSTYTVVIYPASGETLDGVASVDLNPGESIALACDGTNLRSF